LFRLCCLASFLASSVAFAQLPPDTQPDLPFDARRADRLLEAAAGSVGDYVFPDKLPALKKAIQSLIGDKELASIHSSNQFADRVTDKLHESVHDRHLRLKFSFKAIPEPGAAKKESPRESAARRAREAAEDADDNYGFDATEVLPGNIGYLKLHEFKDASSGGATAVAAMSFLAHTRALIFDVRDNRGGDPGMILLILSYLFEQPTHVNDIYWRPDDSTGQFWTSAYVNGSRYPGDVYVLIGPKTFSAAEEFAYDLQAQKRAVVVGQPSGGGAHPITIHRLDDHFLLLVPSGRAINPVTKTDWEGTGVKPDVACAAESALATAHLAALEKTHAPLETIAAAKRRLENSRESPVH